MQAAYVASSGYKVAVWAARIVQAVYSLLAASGVCVSVQSTQAACSGVQEPEHSPAEESKKRIWRRSPLQVFHSGPKSSVPTPLPRVMRVD